MSPGPGVESFEGDILGMQWHAYISIYNNVIYIYIGLWRVDVICLTMFDSYVYRCYLHKYIQYFDYMLGLHGFLERLMHLEVCCS